MGNAVIRHTGYVMAHAPDLLAWHGSSAAQLRQTNPNDSYLSTIANHFRNYDSAVGDPANQCYIGNITPDELGKLEKPWYSHPLEAKEKGKYGETIPEELLYALLSYVDVFELNAFTDQFVQQASLIAKSHPRMAELPVFKHSAILSEQEIQKLVDESHAAALYWQGKIVGCIKAAHAIDTNLNAHIMLENLVTKATAVLAGWQIPADMLQQVEYVIECSEEAIGDVNQRGGGNLAKAVAETLGCQQATGIDMRGFCAGPLHALVNGAALVNSGIYRHVLVIAGGSVAKLGMNGRDHVKNNMPLLEDMLGGFAVLISPDDGESPVLNTRVVGRHTVGTGSSPQAVMSALISQPLKKVGMTTLDVDKFSVEMQNPEITQPAGAGNVPEANYKMIAALSVKEGWLQRDQLMDFVAKKGMSGFAPTQGHIPSGVPFIPHGIDAIDAGTINNFFVVGKGSLFLGRMTNQFDGVSILVERNRGEVMGDDNLAPLAKMLADAMRKVADTLDTEQGG